MRVGENVCDPFVIERVKGPNSAAWGFLRQISVSASRSPQHPSHISTSPLTKPACVGFDSTAAAMLFFRFDSHSCAVGPANRNSFFKTLVDHEVTVELKNDVSIRGTLKSVDQYLNIKLDDITVMDELKYPHLV
jgi:hypothetical protein